jgi:hypothetical protein
MGKMEGDFLNAFPGLAWTDPKQHLFQLEPLAGALAVFGLLIGLLIVGFLAYQFSTILIGKTSTLFCCY